MREKMPEYWDLLEGIVARMDGVGRMCLWANGMVEYYVDGDCVVEGMSYDEALGNYLSFINEWDGND